jgi:hypothetical protein
MTVRPSAASLKRSSAQRWLGMVDMVDMVDRSMASTKIRPEAELLIRCARIGMDAQQEDDLRMLTRTAIDWEYLIQTALLHGMMPLLYWHLHRVCSDTVPAAVLDDLRSRFQQNTRRNLTLTAELRAVLELLGEHQIVAIPYKGPMLASFVYGNLALRQFQDLDILVHKSDVLRAKDLLISRGYQPTLQLTRTQETAYLESNHEYVLWHERDVLLEVHWAFGPRLFSFAFDPEGVWARAERTPLAGTMVLTLSPEDLLLILCMHHSKDAWVRLEWICGVAELIRRHDRMDWSWVVGQADMLGMRRMLFLGLYLVSDVLGAAPPKHVLRAVRADRSVEVLAQRVRRRLFLELRDRGGVFQLSATRIAFHLSVRERVQDKLRYSLRLALSPSVGDQTFLALPPSVSFLYYPLRPLRLAGKWLAGCMTRHATGSTVVQKARRTSVSSPSEPPRV